jgi:hypothetical protein
MTALVVALAFLTVPTGEPCEQQATSLAKGFLGAELSMEHVREIDDIHKEAIAGLMECPDSDEFAYIALRAIVDNLDGRRADDENIAEARRLAARFPKSVRVAAARARLDSTLDAARLAVSIDPKYPPANLALAVALLATGDGKGARAALAQIPDLKVLDDGFATLARLRWAEGDVDAAMLAAKKQLVSHGGLEPGFNVWPGRRIAHEILALGYLRKKRTQEAANHLLQANPDSEAVRALLEHPTPSLRTALAKQRRRSGQ